MGSNADQLQLTQLFVDYHYRGKKFGRQMVDAVRERACAMGATKLYISAIPSENTINFYTHLGCTLTQELDPRLFALEPEDIQLDLIV